MIITILFVTGGGRRAQWQGPGPGGPTRRVDVEARQQPTQSPRASPPPRGRSEREGAPAAPGRQRGGTLVTP